MTWRTMCDSDQIGALTATDFVTTYADLITSHDQVAALRGKYPRSTVLFIDRGLGDPLAIATLGDFEPGALTVDQAATWARTRIDAGHEYVTHYSDQDWLPALITACAGLGTWAWVADPGQLTVPGHPAALTQVLFAPPRGPHIDLSVVKNDAWHPHQGATDLTAEALAQMIRARRHLTDAITTASGRPA